MTEKELLQNLQQLKEIKPRKDWVFLTKQNIFAKERLEQEETSTIITFSEILNYLRFIFSNNKLAVASLSLVLIFGGVFAVAQNSVPGDVLYSLRKATEQAQMSFIPEKEYEIYEFKIVNNRLEDLLKVSQNNSVKNLAPAIEEYETSASQMAQRVVKNNTVKKDPEEIKKAIVDIENIKTKVLEIESLGVLIDNSEIEKSGKVLSIALMETDLNKIEDMILELDDNDLFAEEISFIETTREQLKEIEQRILNLEDIDLLEQDIILLDKIKQDTKELEEKLLNLNTEQEELEDDQEVDNIEDILEVDEKQEANNSINGIN